ncbi:MAG: nickel pincer cofactor biosynthesis protein LarC [Clostridiales bacterium]|nr:nickel pincer cofactor biosynthesis protein LarC [Clostridiales bacterium]
MKILYLDCPMGASGDMLTAALAGLLDDADSFLASLSRLGLPGVEVLAERVSDRGLSGLRSAVTVHGEEEGAHGHHHEHEHSDLGSVSSLIDSMPISDGVKRSAKEVYSIIADAESKVHGKPVELVHFHEVGALDAVLDITAVCLLIEKLAPDKIVASALTMGFGAVKCAHGLLPVPAPATAEILKGVLVTGGDVEGELTTPTGAALIKHYAVSYGAMPEMRLIRLARGFGKKVFAQRANCLTAYLGEVSGGAAGVVAELSCNIDDMTGETLGAACDLLRAEGALEVFLTQVQGKKGRPAVLLTLLCAEEEAERFAGLMLANTSTFGVRRSLCQRYTLERRFIPVQTRWGSVRVKMGTGYGVSKSKAEFEDARHVAEKAGVTVAEVLREVDSLFRENQ